MVRNRQVGLDGGNLVSQRFWKVPREALYVPGFVLVGGPKERYQYLELVRGGDLPDLLCAGLTSSALFLHDRG